MKLEKLYRDIVSLFRAEGLEQSNVYASDIIHAINESISTQRRKQVQAGIKTPFVTNEEIPFSLEDRNLTYLNKADLDKAPLRELPLTETVVTAVAKKTPNRLTQTVKSWSQGDKVTKEGVLYEAVNNIPSSNSYDLTFNHKDVIPYVKNKDYSNGDIIYYNQGQTFWRATSNFTASGDPSADPTEQIYWRKVGRAEIDASVISYKNKRDLRVNDTSITINEKTLFASPDIGYLFLEYVPIWEPVEELDEEIDLPLSVVQAVKQDVFQLLSPKLRTSQSTGDQDE